MDNNLYNKNNNKDRNEENGILKFETHKGWENNENDIVYLKSYDKKNNKSMIIDIQDEDIETMQMQKNEKDDNNIIYINVNNIEKLLKKYNIKNNVEKIIFRYKDEIILTLTKEETA